MRLAVLLMSVVLVGCSFSLQKELPPSSVWRLSVANLSEPEAGVLPINLVITKPHLPASLRSERLVIEQDHRQVDVLAGHQWGQALPSLIQDYWLEYFQTTQRYAAVRPRASSSLPNVVLTAFLWNFDTIRNPQTGTLEVRLKLQAYLNRGQDAPVSVAYDQSLSIDADIVATRGKAAGVVDAHNRLLADISARLHQAVLALARPKPASP